MIVYGTPGQPLIQLVRRPQELLDNPGLRLNGTYYITKQLMPPLDRCFSLLGVDVRQWSVLNFFVFIDKCSGLFIMITIL